jgi:hypothetical protein
MPLPNLDMLDSSISNVVGLLPNEDKINVLLYAVGCLPADGRYVNRISAQDVSYRLLTPVFKMQRGD